MHALQPMQTLLSNSTMPSARWNIASVGQMRTQGGIGAVIAARDLEMAAGVGIAPVSTYLTQVRYTPRGTSFSLLQAVEQAWQPMHLRLSMTNP